MKTCELCGGKLDDNACPLCGVSRVMTDAELEHVVGGMAVLTGIGIALSVFRIFQSARARRERAN